MAKSKALSEGGGFTYAKPVEPFSPALPELFGFALEERAGKFVACRISTLGAREYFGPKQTDGTVRPESKAAALGRMYAAMTAAYSPARNLRFG